MKTVDGASVRVSPISELAEGGRDQISGSTDDGRGTDPGRTDNQRTAQPDRRYGGWMNLVDSTSLKKLEALEKNRLKWPRSEVRRSPTHLRRRITFAQPRQ